MAQSNTDDRVLELLEEAYFDELETIQNYIAHSENLQTVLGEELAEMFRQDVQEELGHAQELAARIHTLGGQVPGSAEFTPTQDSLQPPEDSTDVLSVIDGALDEETNAQEIYRELAEVAGDSGDFVTEDLAIRLLEDEENHASDLRDLRAELE
jgi:bacterioferritin